MELLRGTVRIGAYCHRWILLPNQSIVSCRELFGFVDSSTSKWRSKLFLLTDRELPESLHCTLQLVDVFGAVPVVDPLSLVVLLEIHDLLPR